MNKTKVLVWSLFIILFLGLGIYGCVNSFSDEKEDTNSTTTTKTTTTVPVISELDQFVNAGNDIVANMDARIEAFRNGELNAQNIFDFSELGVSSKYRGTAVIHADNVYLAYTDGVYSFHSEENKLAPNSNNLDVILDENVYSCNVIYEEINKIDCLSRN